MAKWPLKGATKKFQVKVRAMKLQGFETEVAEEKRRIMAVEVRWKGASKPPFVYFNRKSQQYRSFSKGKCFKNGEPIEWDDEFDNLCTFSIASRDSSFNPWIVSFHVLREENEESTVKSSTIGKASVNLGELASKMEAEIERKLPIAFQLDGVAKEATLSLIVNFNEVREAHSRANSHDLLELVPKLGESGNEDNFLKRIESSRFVEGGKVKNKEIKTTKEDLVGTSNSDECGRTDSGSRSEYVRVPNGQSTESSLFTELEPLPSSETELAIVKKAGFWKWKRRRSTSKAANRKEKPLGEKIDGFPDSRQKAEESCSTDSWETKELVSRDGKTKLKAQVFFASYDQCSDKAAGESACTTIVTVIAHWLQSNRGIMPSRLEFNTLILEGSTEWRKLCDNRANTNDFPDRHFDLETIIHAELRPLSILQERSFIGFFCPEKFEFLKEAKSFDDIWNEINENIKDYTSSIYIVSWNDHFFVLKVEADAYYIIDSLGERLHEGCNQAYILKFDHSSLIYEKAEGEGVVNEGEEIICSGKECCREYMKSFLAAIPIRELQEEQEKGTVPIFPLHQRLQIEFHFSSPSSASSSSSTATTAATSPISPFFLHEDCIEL
ncbi:hypothetical protein Nepgr_000840 [Nepenthes gracilis]|uniref:C2 NT-type domain-containing protein n=1 Tax=Nepenthes gracilis TaxID=150966 RepID=A0AAD3RWU8_NEPGR|nr:hypothetical protein Nepgr_000840 [Nepenthes gracilis]